MKMHKNKQILSSVSGLANGSCCAQLQRRVMMPSKDMNLKVRSVCCTGADKSYTDCSLDKESMGSDSVVTGRISDESNPRSRIPVCQSNETIVHCNGNRLRSACKRKVSARLNKNWIAFIRLLTVLRILNAVSIVLCAGKSHNCLFYAYLHTIILIIFINI